MTGNLSSLYQEIPPGCTAYDYDDPGPPFSPESIAAIDSIKNFLSASELAQARRLETVYYAPVMGDGVGTFIPGLRSYPTSLCLYVGRFNKNYYSRMLDELLEGVHPKIDQADLGRFNLPWFRVTAPDGLRHYPLEVRGNLLTWKEQMTNAAAELGTTLAWFDRGKFCFADGRRFSFGDVAIDRLAGGKPIPNDW